MIFFFGYLMKCFI